MRPNLIDEVMRELFFKIKQLSIQKTIIYYSVIFILCVLIAFLVHFYTPSSIVDK